jgi:hypothetical protein
MRATFFSRLLDVAVVLATLASQSGIATAAATERDVSALANSTYVYIATVRKDGNQSKAAPVWFVMNEHNRSCSTPTPAAGKSGASGGAVRYWCG